MEMNKEAVQSALKGIIWDYHVDPDDLFEVLAGKREMAGPFNAERLFVRMLERLPWYELIETLGIKYIKDRLSESIIKKIRFKTLRGRYETVRKVLSGDTLSFSGWDSEYREKIKHTLLSNRRYRAQ
jgi:hypothetical protein